ncbi:GNAT family N-acetyltransferase [Pseudomonas sp. MIS38]|uniref:GNAT family N-acetyltransferase n=1 Tax=Pseudomonas sp. MIS38 TaxID=91465 RepID=UPI00223BC492|nr:GNAT family N-acetyltransferase [Pseudomonas sp. MIS38]
MSQGTTAKTKNLELSAPEKLNEMHDFSAFECGEASIDTYVKRALKAQAAKDAVIYVTCRKGSTQVLGFYTLTNGAVVRDEAPKKLQRNAPNPCPVTILGRLGVDKTIQGQGVAKALLQDAIERSIAASETVGSRALLVHALDQDLANFYKKYAGFIESSISPLTLMLSLK